MRCKNFRIFGALDTQPDPCYNCNMSTMKQELFDIIKDPVNHKHNKADQLIRAELVRIKESIDLIDQIVFDLADPSGVLASTIQGRTSEIEHDTIEVANDLDDYQRRINGEED